MSVQRRARGLWLVKIYLGMEGGEKKYYSELVRGNKRDAEIREAELVFKHAPNSFKNLNQITLGEFIEQWEKNNFQIRGESTRNTYKVDLKKIKSHDIMNVRLEHLSKPILRDFFKGLSAPEGARKLLHIILTEASEEDLIAYSRVLDLFKGLKDRRPSCRSEIEILTHEEMDRFLEAGKSDPYYNIFVLMLNTGLRIGEAHALTWDDIDFEKKLLRVNKNRYRGINKDGTKTPSGMREISLSNYLINVLRTQRKIVLEQRMKAKEWEDYNLVFPNKRGYYPDYYTFLRHMHNILSRAGIEKRGTHLLRHTFASMLIDSGVPISRVSKILGHANPGITARLYVHPVKEHLKDAIETMSRIMQSSAKKTASTENSSLDG